MIVSVTLLHPKDNDLSSVTDELEALNYELQQIAASISKIDLYNEIVNDYEITSIRRRLDTAIQRSYRAEQAGRGIKVYKAR